jgi:hypothetical protein
MGQHYCLLHGGATKLLAMLCCKLFIEFLIFHDLHEFMVLLAFVISMFFVHFMKSWSFIKFVNP